MLHTTRRIRLTLLVPALIITAVIIALWPISYTKGLSARARYVWVRSEPGTSNPSAGFSEASVLIDRGRLVLTLDAITSTRMGLMGWGPMEPGLSSRVDAFEPGSQGPHWYYNSWRYWRAGPFETEFRSGPQARARVAIPLWLLAIGGGMFTIRAFHAGLALDRARRNLCSRCHYPRGGLDASSRCPECGVSPAEAPGQRKNPEPKGPGAER